MHNLFPPRDFLEEIEDAASGACEILPQNTLREKNYQQVPLIVMPKYEGDFLNKLRGKIIEAADSQNLMDFSMPSEKLKNLEFPYPRVLVDDFYEFSRPTTEEDYDVLKEYWNRSWDTSEAPEMSEDRPLRKGPMIHTPDKEEVFKAAYRVIKAFLSKPDPGIIVAYHLMRCLPIEFIFDRSIIKTAKLLSELKSEITTKEKGRRDVSPAGVSASLMRAEPRSGRWTFSTRSTESPGSYRTVFQFIPYGTIRDLDKLHVRVSCSCPSWLFWGAQYHAVMGDYLYGKIRPKYAPPGKRDKAGKFLVCKHVLACLPILSNYKMGEIPEELVKKIKKAPRFEVEKDVPEEKLRIPAELISVGRRSKIKAIVEQWNESNPQSRKKMIMGLRDPKEVAFFAHRFPDTATHFVAQKLKAMATQPALEREAERLLEDIKDVEETRVDIPSSLKTLDTDANLQQQLKSIEGKNKGLKRKFIMDQTDPDTVAYAAYKLYHDPLMTSYALEKLNEMSKDMETNMENVRAKAKTWFKALLGG